MAIITTTYRSEVLKRDISFKAYLPFDHPTIKNEKYRTLYMLHGLTHNMDAWLNSSRIDRLARDLNLAVIFPNGENSFYVEGLTANSDFGKLIGEEIVNVTRNIFPLSTDRNDTFIGGVSMGGFGALRNGLKYADTFSKIITFSAAIHMFEFEPNDPNRTMIINEDSVMGDYYEAVKTDKNPAICLKQLSEKVKNKQSQFPEIYMICGLQDNLLQANRSFKNKLENEGVNVKYEEMDGDHSYNYWNIYLPDLLKWLVE